MRARYVLAAALICVGVTFGGPAHAQETCRRAVILTLPGVTWEDVARADPPALTAMIEAGSAGSISVRTNTSRTSYSSGYATLGGGARLNGAPATGGTAWPGDRPLEGAVRVAGYDALVGAAREAGYAARPGALAGALGDHALTPIGNSDLGLPPPTPNGAGRWALLAAMDRNGRIEHEFSGTGLLRPDPAAPFGVRTDPAAISAAIDDALTISCGSLVVDPGDLTRADVYADLTFSELPTERDRALLAADDILGHLRGALDFDRDLLIAVSPTSPAWAPEARLGVAVAEGPGWGPGSTLQSASTRRRGVVTLPDVAPTVLRHLGIHQPPSMNGRSWFDVEAPGDRIAAAIDLNQESVFVDGIKGAVSAGFVVCQVVVYLLALGLLALRESRGGAAGKSLAWWLEVAALALAAFPIATFFGGIVKAHEVGLPLLLALLLAIDAALVAIACIATGRALDRLLILTALTLAVMIGDLMTGARLQLNTVFGYSPIVAGRFAGAGNIAFAVLGASTVLTGALIVHRWRNRAALIGVGVLFAVVVVIVGAPAFGSDVGGVLALVPALAITWLLLSGRRPNAKLLIASLAAAVAALAVFIAIDLSGPPESRTHLARLFEDVRSRGFDVLFATIERKAASNIRVFTSTIWTLFVPPALGAMAWFLARPRGRWGRLAEVFPKIRAGLAGGLVVALLGFAVNDSGIVIPAVVLSFLVPMALLVHLVIEMEVGPSG